MAIPILIMFFSPALSSFLSVISVLNESLICHIHKWFWHLIFITNMRSHIYKFKAVNDFDNKITNMFCLFVHEGNGTLCTALTRVMEETSCYKNSCQSTSERNNWTWRRWWGDVGRKSGQWDNMLVLRIKNMYVL